MITIAKPSKLYYPVRWVYFADDPSALPEVHPWDIVVCKQANEAVREAVQDRAILVREFHTLLSDLTQPIDVLWQHIGENRRRCIKKIDSANACDCGFEIHLNQLSTAEFYEYYSTFSRLKGFCKPCYRSLDALLKRCNIVHATYHGECCAISTSLCDGTSRARGMHFINNFAPSITGQTRTCISSALLWWEIQYYKAKGVKLYDYGGIFTDPSAPVYGITTYKESFGGKRHQEWDVVLTGSLIKPFSRIIAKQLT